MKNKQVSFRNLFYDFRTFTCGELKQYSLLVNRLHRNLLFRNVLILFFLFGLHSNAQDSTSIEKKTFFSFTPQAKHAKIVNGMTFGLGLEAFEGSTIPKVNGLNLEINPLSPLIFLFANPHGFEENITSKVNGISISTGNIGAAKINGVCISFLNFGHTINGLSLNASYNYNTNLRGLHISTFFNISENGEGLFLAFSNSSQKLMGGQIGVFNRGDSFNGFQIGILNKSDSFKGIQLGLFNNTKKQKGIQIGLWNTNSKRSMPILNW